MKISTKLANMLVDFWRCNRRRLYMYEKKSKRYQQIVHDNRRQGTKIYYDDLFATMSFTPLEQVQLSMLRKTCSVKRKLLTVQLKKEQLVPIWNDSNMIDKLVPKDISDKHRMACKALSRYRKSVKNGAEHNIDVLNGLRDEVGIAWRKLMKTQVSALVIVKIHK